MNSSALMRTCIIILRSYGTPTGLRRERACAEREGHAPNPTSNYRDSLYDLEAVMTTNPNEMVIEPHPPYRLLRSRRIGKSLPLDA